MNKKVDLNRPGTPDVANFTLEVTRVESNGSSIIIGTYIPEDLADAEEMDYPESAEAERSEYDTWLG